MKIVLLLSFLFSLQLVVAQTKISGTVTNQNGKAIAAATVFIKGTVNFFQTDANGNYSFTTTLKGKHEIGFKKQGFQELFLPIDIVGEAMTQNAKLSAVKEIEEIVISAGSINANNDRSVAILNPLDIVTTAGGQGDIAGALQTLPGVQRNGGDQTGLMVRGGDVNESTVLVDGLVAQNAFGSSVPGVGQRTRFNPFQFKGTSFSTGGYSARFGQALSSVLDLQTNDLPDESNVDIGGNFAGLSVGGTKLFENSAVEFTANYLNLSPFLLISQPNVEFSDAPQGFGVSGRYVAKTPTRGMFKTTFNQTFNKSGLKLIDPANPANSLNFGIKNDFNYVNTTYKDVINKNWLYFVGFSSSSNADAITWDSLLVIREDRRVQGRTEFIYAPSVKMRAVFGTEIQHFTYNQKFDTLLGQFSELLSAVYAEADIIPVRKLAFKPGIRAEYSKILGKGNISPRFAAAIKTSKTGQISLASGVFYQIAASNYLLQGYRPNFQQAIHLMANYQLMAKDRVFRIEGYYKSYDQLVKENGTSFTPNQFRFDLGQVDNSGSGYAQGIDFFWRDKKSIQNFDYWVSYSYIDTKRLYQNYTEKVTPDYVSDHNLNIVMKYFWMKAQTNFSATYSYASGRPYFNPNATSFLADRAPAFQNLALTVSYLTTIKKMFTVFYLSIDNITNRKNILGYRYSMDGMQQYPILPPFYFNVFFGFNMSLKEFNKDEL
jgi:hypothetical protein